MQNLNKGRRQNSLAAAPIFSSQLQPTCIIKVSIAVAAFWLQSAVMYFNVFHKPSYVDIPSGTLIYMIII